MRWMPKWIIHLLGDDRNLLHPVPPPTLKCVACNRFVTLTGKSKSFEEWLHTDDASPVCSPIGLYRSQGVSQ